MIFKTTPKKLIKKALKKGYDKKHLKWVINHPYAIEKYKIREGILVGVNCSQAFKFTLNSDWINTDKKYLELNFKGKLIGECD